MSPSKIKHHSFTNNKNVKLQRTALVAVVCVFALIGVYFTWRSLAATGPTVAVEAENGTLGGATKIANNNAASGAEAVSFGATPAPGGGGGGSTNGSCTGKPQVVWCDNFDGDALSLSDTTAHRNWLPSEQGVNDNGHPGGGSFSWEATPKGTPGLKLWTVANGALTMRAVRNNGQYQNVPGNYPWIGGTINTDPASGLGWTYGYFEFRARVPVHGKGMFPALWLYRSVDVAHHSDAEFDLMEIFGSDSQPWSTTIHGNGQRDSTDGDRGYNSDTVGWHRYGVDWQPGHVAFYRDGVEYARRTGGLVQWFNGAKMGIRMDYAANPNFNNNHSDNNTPNPLYMEIDYVRVYKNKPDLAPGTGDPYGG